MSSKLPLAAGLSLWILAMGYGERRLVVYAQTPGPQASPPTLWPEGAPVKPAENRATLLLFAHPQCPCTRATIGELALIMACCRDRVDATVFLYIPSGGGREWSEFDLARDAAIIPGVRVVRDPDAAAARLFGARTSGQVLLYDASRRLVFNGGITILRGHSGDNDGRDAITDLLRAPTGPLAGAVRTAPVFGCALFGD